MHALLIICGFFDSKFTLFTKNIKAFHRILNPQISFKIKSAHCVSKMIQKMFYNVHKCSKCSIMFFHCPTQAIKFNGFVWSDILRPHTRDISPCTFST